MLTHKWNMRPWLGNALIKLWTQWMKYELNMNEMKLRSTGPWKHEINEWSMNESMPWIKHITLN